MAYNDDSSMISYILSQNHLAKCVNNITNHGYCILYLYFQGFIAIRILFKSFSLAKFCVFTLNNRPSLETNTIKMAPTQGN